MASASSALQKAGAFTETAERSGRQRNVCGMSALPGGLATVSVDRVNRGSAPAAGEGSRTSGGQQRGRGLVVRETARARVERRVRAGHAGRARRALTRRGELP